MFPPLPGAGFELEAAPNMLPEALALTLGLAGAPKRLLPPAWAGLELELVPKMPPPAALGFGGAPKILFAGGPKPPAAGTGPNRPCP